MAAVIELRCDASSVMRTLGQIERRGKAVGTVLGTDFARGAEVANAAFEQLAQNLARSHAELRKLQRRTAQEGEAAARRATQVSETEGNYRVNVYKHEADEARSSSSAIARAREAAERRVTATTRQETQQRLSLFQRFAAQVRALGGGSEPSGGPRGGRRAGRGGGGGPSVGGTLGMLDRIAGVTGQITADTQGAQERWAGIEDNFNHALFQATRDPREIANSTRRFAAFARDNNLDLADVAQAAADTQGRFNTLGARDMTPAQREARQTQFMANYLQARNLGQDPTQFTMLAGALSGANLSASTQSQVMRTLAGYANRGSVELGNLTADALRPMMGAIASAQGGGPAAIQEAIQQQMAALEVLAPRGLNAGPAGNTLNQIRATLGNERTQAALLAHTRNQFGRNSALEQRLFDNGHLRNEFKDAYAFGEAVSGALGNDPDALRNFLGTGRDRATGHVLRQVMTNPQRELLAALGSRDGNNKTGYDAIRELRAGDPLSAADEEAGRALFGRSTRGMLDKSATDSLLGLIGNAGFVQQANNTRAFEAQHPYLNRILGAIPGGDFIKQGAVGMQTGGDAAAGNMNGSMGGLPATGATGLPVSLSPQSIQQLAQALRQNPPTIAPGDAALIGAQQASAPRPPRP